MAIDFRVQVPERYAELPPKEILNRLTVNPAWTVADIGCGKGAFTPILLEYFGKQGFVYAVDIVPEILERLAHRFSDFNFKSVLATPDKIPLPDELLHLAILNFTLHEAPDRQQLLKEVYRLLKPYHYLIITEWQQTAADRTSHRKDRLSLTQLRNYLQRFNFTEIDVEKLQTIYLIILQKGGIRK